ncbi:hypothetical protein [Cryptosporangium minutisporangium]|uniref:hypothetical protein n=1 Tax=Cryptosporangium minutisporangium TaxID=113569 RepID=UPI0035ED192D
MTTRELNGADLPAALAAAQQALLAAASTGRAADQVWLLPPGTHRISGTLDLGAPGVALTLRGRRTILGLVPVPGSAGSVTALGLGGSAVVLEDVEVTCAPVDADLVGIRLTGSARVAVRRVRVTTLHAATTTGLRLEAPRVELTDTGAADLAATTGPATGVQITAADSPGDAADGIVTGVRISVSRVRGPQARGLSVDAAAGSLTGLTISDTEEPLRISAGVTTAEVHIERLAEADALVAWLAAAQERLVAAPAGSGETWRLPAGSFELDAGLRLGVEGRNLTVTGSRDTELVFGGAAPLPGDLVGLDVRGDRVRVAQVSVRARATGALTGVRATGTVSAHVDDVRVSGLRGADVFGLEVTAPEAALTGVTADDVRATGTTATTLGIGVAVTGDRVGVSRLTVARLRAPLVTGLGLTAAERADVALLRLTDIAGTEAEGAQFRVVGPPDTHRELSLLDVRAEQVRGTGDSAIGLVLFVSGDLGLRGVSVAGVEAATAYGVLAVAAGALDWLGGTVTDIRGVSRGAAGARLLAIPSPSAFTVRDVHVEAVRGAAVGPSAQPSPSWRSWLDRVRPWVGDGTGVGPPGPFATADPTHVDDVAGLHVCAPVDESEPWLESVTDAGEVIVAECVVRRVSGTAVQIDGELRDSELRGVEVWTAIRSGHLAGERIRLAQLTVHRVQTGLQVAAGALTAADSLLTGVVDGAALVPGVQAEVDAALAVFATGAPPPFQLPPEPLYVTPGPVGIPPSVLAGGLAPSVAVDLRLADPTRHALAVRVPGDGDDVPVYLGAHPPDADAHCALRDPDPPLTPVPPPVPPPGPPVDYRARDARGLLGVITDRASRVLPGWAPTGPADQTTMWLELLAARLDQLAYRQEVAVAEGYLGTAQSRRSVEDHARLVDYEPDAGLSATTMVELTLDPEPLGLAGALARTGAVVVPAGTLVVNPDAADRLVVFATEEDLPVDPALAELRPAEPVPVGATSAILAEDLTGLRPGRWLVLLAASDVDVPPHVVRVTAVELGTDTTRVSWDPRRPAPVAYLPGACTVLGNVVPAHHGLPLTPLAAQGAAAVLDDAELLRPWRERLTVRVTGGDTREVDLPWQPVSRHAAGWPLPDHPARTGVPQVRLSVDGEPWTLADDLATLGPGDESFVLRPGHTGGVAAVVGDGVTGTRLPDREVTVEFGVRIGLGAIGNVAAGTLVRLLALGSGGDADLLLGTGDADRVELLRRHLRVTNPVPAIGGRDPEPLERIRYAAPLGVRELLSAVVPADYERLVGALPEVAAARARVRTDAPRPVVRVTLLLRDEDALTVAGPPGEAERLRRWAVARIEQEDVRLLGFDVELVPPRFVPIDLDLSIDAAAWARAETVRAGVVAALAGDGGLLDPDTSGLGGDVHLDAVHRRVLDVPGVDAVRVRRLRRLQPGAADHRTDGVLPVGTEEVAVLRHPYGPTQPQGLLTVEVCGGVP